MEGRSLCYLRSGEDIAIHVTTIDTYVKYECISAHGTPFKHHFLRIQECGTHFMVLCNIVSDQEEIDNPGDGHQ